MISYPAVIELDEDGESYNVHFPDLEVDNPFFNWRCLVWIIYRQRK